jgi:membrane associated rhomboid family serine protease
MFPIRDHNPSRRTPFVTWALIAVNAIVFLSYAGLLANEEALLAFFGRWAMIPARISTGEGYATVLTSMFLHGGLLHIAGNMLFLYIFGDNLEEILGHGKFLGFYLLSGIGAALLQYLADPFSTVPMVGASGAIAGVLGGYLLLFPRARVDVLIVLVIFIRLIALPAWVMLGFWFALQVVSGYATFGTQEGGVAYLAHAGGFAVGFLLALPAWIRLGGPAFWRRTHGHPPHPEAVWRNSPIPRVRRRR